MGEMDIVLSLEDWGSIDLQQVVTKDRTTQVSGATLWVSKIHYRKVANLFSCTVLCMGCVTCKSPESATCVCAGRWVGGWVGLYVCDMVCCNV